MCVTLCIKTLNSSSGDSWTAAAQALGMARLVLEIYRRAIQKSSIWNLPDTIYKTCKCDCDDAHALP